MAKQLVTGYFTARRYDAVTDWVMVKHLAVFDNGEIKITRDEFSTSCTWFNNGFDWETIETMPVDLEYVGIYPANM